MNFKFCFCIQIIPFEKISKTVTQNLRYNVLVISVQSLVLSACFSAELCWIPSSRTEVF